MKTYFFIKNLITYCINNYVVKSHFNDDSTKFCYSVLDEKIYKKKKKKDVEYKLALTISGYSG